MHLIRAAGAVCLAVVLIAGCRLNEEQQQAEGENTAVTHMKSVPYSNFSLRVSYGDGEHNRYEGIYEKNGTHETAAIQDKVSGINQEGEEALDEMKMILSEPSVTDQMAEKEVIHSVLAAFNLDSHYDHIDLKLKLKNGAVREIKK
ncbi:YusW family protein [Bacillus halotolerans]|uniref:YusW family protein n=1 Tax=Bacillus halotolerans TaxID=260554 RepID=UPI0020C3E029|nr:YusW family protein [Bacillus halotolerans]UTL71983.1 YusW family protein [Bacillus halotolerans]